MSALNSDAIKALSKLCRLELSEEESALIGKDLKQILDYISLLSEADVTTLAPASHFEPLGIENLREDMVEETLPRSLFLANAPDHVGGMVRVPPVFGKPGDKS